MKNIKRFFAFICLLIIAVSVIPFSGCENAKSDTFDENNIVLSFSAMSDIHQQKGKVEYKNKLVKALKYAKQLNGKTLDLALFAGDLTEEGWRQTNKGEQTDYTTEYNADIDMLKEAIKEGVDINETGIFYTLGNHDTDPSVLGVEVMGGMPALFKKQLGDEFFRIDAKDSDPEKGRRHAVVNGYHFISVQPDYYWRNNGYSKETLEWLDKMLAAATKENKEKYVFVTAHPPLYDTVFGSCTPTWSDQDLKNVFMKYPQVIYFSGHVHNVLQDEIQISQDGICTALDCGSVKYTDWMNNVNENLTRFDNDCGTRINDFSQGLLIQVDNNGNVKVTRCDYYNEAVIKDPWTLSYPKADKSHLKKYDNDSRTENNEVPVFAEDTKIDIKKENGVFSLNWKAATDDDMVRYYLLNAYVVNNGKKTKVKTFYLATFTYRYDKVSDMPKDFEWMFSEETFRGYCGKLNVTYTDNLYFELRAVDVWFGRSAIISASYSG